MISGLIMSGLLWRGLILFSLGESTALYCVCVYDGDVGLGVAVAVNQVWSLGVPAWLVLPLLAACVTATGILYPSAAYSGHPDISEIMRCVAVFVGIFQASTVSARHSLQYLLLMPTIQKIDFSSYIELAVTMGALGVGMWWLFDRSRGGLLLSFVLTLLYTILTYTILLAYNVR